ncbi:MAG: hypothetical protein AB1449_02250 [Chloroflexota bacterium]
MTTAFDRIGFHYYPDDRHYTQSDLQSWLPVLHGLRARWLVLCAGPERAVPEAFIRGLLEAGIKPIVHLQAPIARAGASNLAPLLTAYGRWGVEYVVVFDRPNVRDAWPAEEWARPGLVERFADVLLPLLQAQRAAGLRAVLPPLEPGGDYWDTAFLPALLDSLARRGQAELLADLTLAIYAWTFDRPADWGAGGPGRWPEARPYHTPEGCQDQRGLHACDWYAALVAERGVPSLPMIVIAGGALRRVSAPAVGPDPYIEQNLAAARALLAGDLPDAVLNFAFYPLVTEARHPHYASAWFEAPDQPRPIVTSLQQLLHSLAKAADNGRPKPIQHYLLLPSGAGASWLQEWSHLAEFAAAHHPVIGFSNEEARLARRVTIVGGEEVCPLALEQDLRAAGCEVDRIRVQPAPIPSEAGETHD